MLIPKIYTKDKSILITNYFIANIKILIDIDLIYFDREKYNLFQGNFDLAYLLDAETKKGYNLVTYKISRSFYFKFCIISKLKFIIIYIFIRGFML
jgi:hypothetical protein